MTPLERRLAGKDTFASDEEAAEFGKKELERTTYDNGFGGGPLTMLGHTTSFRWSAERM
jgi:hypothetical protein